MRARKFTHHDLQSVNKWLRKQGEAEIGLSQLPSLGFIVPGVAAGFLRDCEGDIAMLDSLVSNPYASSNTRHSGLETIFKTIIQFANGRTLFGFTSDSGTLLRAQAHGFKQLPMTCLARIKE